MPDLLNEVERLREQNSKLLGIAEEMAWDPIWSTETDSQCVFCYGKFEMGKTGWKGKHAPSCPINLLAEIKLSMVKPGTPSR